MAESEAVPSVEATSETQEQQGETTIEDSDDKVETQVEAVVKETIENEGENGQNGKDDESVIKDKEEEAQVEDQEVSEDMEQEGNEIEEEKEIEEENVIEEEKDQNDEIEEIEEIEDIDENEKAVEKDKDSNEIENETNGNKTQEQPASKENNDHNVSGVDIEMDEDNFEPDFELDDNQDGSKNDEVVMQADSEDEIEFLAEVEADRSELEKQKKRAIAEELVLCLICHEICNRGIIVKCCGAQACRACAMKKVIIEIIEYLKN